ncbi:NAD(P)-binding domain containing protein [Parasponia andersonii]|uniref:NAD(P)-binding domain containing protein n=1 Tax=Parasponia andersonii TaxID=3476 RepID=A0A2P5B097_PARAD|nr:NAD(P)-binding domain containing protein [Parasponia andersonii]
MEKTTTGCKVCVTGGSGNIASWLVNKLLHQGYTVHATLRNLDDVSKVNFLKRFPGAETRLVLFKADIYTPDDFENAIQGCQYVFHVATPLLQTNRVFQYENSSEATIGAAKSIAMFCARSGTVKRLIYTASVVAASPLKDDGSGFKDSMDETCWTPLNLSIPYSNDAFRAYLYSKTIAEKELLSMGNQNGTSGLEVVTLACGLVGGDTILPFTPFSVAMLYSQLKNTLIHYNSLKYLEELLGKVPIIHIDDVCEALIFSMVNPSMCGRFLCASSYISCAEIASYYQQHYPQFHVKNEYLEGPTRKIEFNSSKLIEKGFMYKYDAKMILDDCINCGKRLDDL